MKSIERRAENPNEEARQRGRSYVWARATDAGGRRWCDGRFLAATPLPDSPSIAGELALSNYREEQRARRSVSGIRFVPKIPLSN